MIVKKNRLGLKHFGFKFPQTVYARTVEDRKCGLYINLDMKHVIAQRYSTELLAVILSDITQCLWVSFWGQSLLLLSSQRVFLTTTAPDLLTRDNLIFIIIIYIQFSNLFPFYLNSVKMLCKNAQRYTKNWIKWVWFVTQLVWGDSIATNLLGFLSLAHKPC